MAETSGRSTVEWGGGWQVVPGEPPGTLGWSDGTRVSVIAIWAADHWEYVTDEWAGRDPPPGALPLGVVDPRCAGWWRAPDGDWYPPPPVGGRVGMGWHTAQRGEISVLVSVVGLIGVVVGLFTGAPVFWASALVVLLGAALGLVTLLAPRSNPADRFLGAAALAGLGVLLALFGLLLMAVIWALSQMSGRL